MDFQKGSPHNDQPPPPPPPLQFLLARGTTDTSDPSSTVLPTYCPPQYSASTYSASTSTNPYPSRLELAAELHALNSYNTLPPQYELTYAPMMEPIAESTTSLANLYSGLPASVSSYSFVKLPPQLEEKRVVCPQPTEMPFIRLSTSNLSYNQQVQLTWHQLLAQRIRSAYLTAQSRRKRNSTKSRNQLRKRSESTSTLNSMTLSVCLGRICCPMVLICALVMLVSGLVLVIGAFQQQQWQRRLGQQDSSDQSIGIASLSRLLLGGRPLVTGQPSTAQVALHWAHWFREAMFYEVFPASFKDSDGDGVGDLRGLLSRLPYMRELGVNVLRLNSILHALDYPYQYRQVLNHTRLEPKLGSLVDLQNLISNCERVGIQVVMDFDLTITSDQHAWAAGYFLANGAASDFHNFYANTSDYVPPVDAHHNTESHISAHSHVSESALTGHLYLNHSNWFVRQQMLNSMHFWLQQGVQGFYLTNLQHLHFNAENPEHVLQLLGDIRALLERHTQPDKPRPIIIGNKLALDELTRRMRGPYLERAYRVRGATFAHDDPHSSFDLLDTFLQLRTTQSEVVRDQVNDLFLNSHFHRSRVLWNMGNHQTARLAERFPLAHTSLAQFLLVMLPGAISIFYGDEIAQREPTETSESQAPGLAQLAPMAWSSHGMYANFTQYESTPAPNILLKGNSNSSISEMLAPEVRPWQDMHADASIQLNVQKQQESVIKLRQLLAFRRQYLLSNWTDETSNNKTQMPADLRVSHQDYLFHYVNQGQLVLERHLLKPKNVRKRFVLFSNMCNCSKQSDFSEKFYFGTIKLASNIKRLRDFLYLNALQLDAGEALIAQIE